MQNERMHTPCSAIAQYVKVRLCSLRAHASIIAAMSVILAASMEGQTVTVLHDFSYGQGFLPFGDLSAPNPDGEVPNSLIAAGNMLYGTTGSGGASGGGAVFAIGFDGTGFTIPHSFTATNLYNVSTNIDGAGPIAGMVVSNGILYGTTAVGGASANGTVFQINIDGTGFKTLHSFAAESDGAHPWSGLLLSSNTLYGTTGDGGSFGGGTVFKIGIDGSGFSVLHDFAYSADGAAPFADLILFNNTLYGTASWGGASGDGAVFRINTDGTGFTNLYSFTANPGENSDGSNPLSPLVLSDNSLYGTTVYGGSTGAGTLFKVNTDGSGFAVVHNFIYGVDGAYASGGLVLSGNALYGMTDFGAPLASGTIFTVNTDGTGFAILYSGSIVSGGDLILSSNLLYGATGNTIFQMNTDGTEFTNLYSLAGDEQGGINPLVLSAGTFYATTPAGGAMNDGGTGNGTIFTVRADGTGFSNLYNFSAVVPDPNLDANGSSPNSVIWSDDVLYGTTRGAGSPSGTVFRVNDDGTAFTNLYTFPSGVTPATVIASGNSLYGAASYSGTSSIGSNGMVFKLNSDGTGFANLHTFASDGTFGPSVLVLSSNALFGATYNIGTQGQDTLFKINTDGTGFTNLHVFTGADGSQPNALAVSGGTIYGTANYGGQAGYGTVFQVNTDGTGFAVLHSFSSIYGNSTNTTFNYTNSDGAQPDILILSGNTLYGSTQEGGNSGSGTIFKINTGTSNFNVISDGFYYGVVGMAVSGGTLFLATPQAQGANGAVVALSAVAAPQLRILSLGQNVILTWPTNETGYVLQSTTNLNPSPMWTPVSPSPVVLNGQNIVTNTIVGSQAFYRLSQ
jgi:uncharacterized repeat protein (TIGR03803 family)